MRGLLNIHFSTGFFRILMIFLALLPSFTDYAAFSNTFQESLFSHSETLRLESLSLEKNEKKNLYFKGISANLTMDLRNRISENMILNLNNKLDLLGSNIDEYNFDEYAYGLLYNTFQTNYAYDISDSTSMELVYENDYFKNRVKPYDDNFGSIVNFFLDNVLLRRIGDEALYYKISSASPFHNRFLLYDYDLLNEYSYNRIKGTIDHAVNRYRFFTFTGDLTFRRYGQENYSRLDDFKSNDRVYLTAKLYQFFPGKYYEKGDDPDRMPPYDPSLLDKDEYLMLKRHFDHRKKLDYSVDERDLFMELSYSFDKKDVIDYSLGDYESHTLTGRAGQDIFEGLRLTLEDSFTVRSFSPQASYYEDYKANQFVLSLDSRLTDTLSSSFSTSMEFEMHPTYPDRDYSRKRLNGSMTQVIDKGTFAFYELASEWFTYDLPSSLHASYRKLNLNLVLSHRISERFTAEIGDELLFYDYYDDSSSALYRDTRLNSLSIAGIFTINTNLSVDFGFKREDYIYKNSAELSSDTQMYYWGTNYRF
ncbi:MAG: hypothetical protein CVV64_02195 [Candidatus Wallbacteria bacterium HGW-Wallbacteria-1]|uniref:Uncharacterized protein n=1 Tax=Candidatus Wallbacteria bacterium HGW-Wallbacteria-1 TaxID=2013854 RepID=A0A2N1PV70_9BACT|nr:MAG: hypothetical protein CVV64_02195 [Candidatus Wallbacteria bacterium HGW-Wallbacteria-1]